jgi:hypothetical protein
MRIAVRALRNPGRLFPFLVVRMRSLERLRQKEQWNDLSAICSTPSDHLEDGQTERQGKNHEPGPRWPPEKRKTQRKLRTRPRWSRCETPNNLGSANDWRAGGPWVGKGLSPFAGSSVALAVLSPFAPRKDVLSRSEGRQTETLPAREARCRRSSATPWRFSTCFTRQSTK